MKKLTKLITALMLLIPLALVAAAPRPAPRLQGHNPDPPAEPVKLIFIHHSTGENWLADDYGDLGITLSGNNYFVSDTNYGWGPDGIGDNTDIPNWMQWFRSDQTLTYMDALFNESGQNASYTRTIHDPGGENQIIMFKSCFPNSELEGDPNDPPGTYEDMSVAGAKFVYNQILTYFATRPDKLFIVITAPPLSDSTYADNARAFNQWLVHDWLSENNYTLNNVAVFDFYNVLTGPDAHHRYINGNIEHAVGGNNTLHYPSGDDHPSQGGSRKATGEFVSLLNVYYHNWQADAPTAPPEDSQPHPTAESQSQPESPPSQPTLSGLIDDFEGDAPIGSYGWETYWDAATDTEISCAPTDQVAYLGKRSMKITYDIELHSWGTCDLTFEHAQNWGDSSGIGFYVHAEGEGTFFNVDLMVEHDQGVESYVHQVRLDSESAAGWQGVFLTWDQFERVSWEADAGAVFNKPDQIKTLAFGFNTPEGGEPPVGIIYIDALSLGDNAADLEQPASDREEILPSPSGGRSLPCAGSLLLPLGLVGFAVWRKKGDG
ncbi:MAG: carbohydrate binding domain-containing protein [Chloroflexota bacterium]